MKKFKTACLAISLLSPAPVFATCTNPAEAAWSHIIWLILAPYLLALPTSALCLLAFVLFGVFEGRKQLQRCAIFISAFALLSSLFFFGTVVFGDSGATV